MDTDKILIFNFGLGYVGEGCGRGAALPQTTAQAELPCVASTDANFNASLFTPVHGSDGKKDSVDLHGILSAKSWFSYSAQSVKSVVSNMYFLRYLHRHNMWEHADGAWVVQMLPEGCIIHDKKSSDEFLVVKVLQHAALVWPVVKGDDDVRELDLRTDTLEWFVTFSVDDLEVLPCMVPSPLHCHVGRLGHRPGFAFKPLGPRKSFMDFHAHRGFLGIDEGVLRALCVSEGMPAIADAVHHPDLPVADQMVLNLCATYIEGLTEEQAHILLMKRILMQLFSWRDLQLDLSGSDVGPVSFALREASFLKSTAIAICSFCGCPVLALRAPNALSKFDRPPEQYV
jgi:hypothetical protein